MTDEDEIRGLLERYERALNTSDARLAASCYATGAILIPPNQPTVRGAEIQDLYDQFFKAAKMDVSSQSTSWLSPAARWPTR